MDEFKDYLNKIQDPAHHARLKEVLTRIAETFPELGRRMGWNQPIFTDHGTFIIAFSEAIKHMAVAPEQAALRTFAADIARSGYDMSNMLFRIPWEDPVDYALLERIIRFNIEDKKDCGTFWRK